ncbi:MAG: hypothetical protein IJH20_00550 [Bacilli bacterium]|nr:hypothetical protein [Bacilli bacterium]
MASIESIITYSTDEELLSLAKVDLDKKIEQVEEKKLNSISDDEYIKYSYLLFLRQQLINNNNYKKMH